MSARDRFDEQADAISERIVDAIAPLGSTSQGRRETVREKVSRECLAIAAALRSARSDTIEDAAKECDVLARASVDPMREAVAKGLGVTSGLYAAHRGGVIEAAQRIRALLTPDASGKGAG